MVDIDRIFHGQLEIGSFSNLWHDGLISREARCHIRLMWVCVDVFTYTYTYIRR